MNDLLRGTCPLCGAPIVLSLEDVIDPRKQALERLNNTWYYKGTSWIFIGSTAYLIKIAGVPGGFQWAKMAKVALERLSVNMAWHIAGKPSLMYFYVIKCSSPSCGFVLKRYCTNDPPMKYN